MVGSALVHQDKVIHIAFFRMGKSEKAGKMSASSRRRHFRVQSPCPDRVDRRKQRFKYGIGGSRYKGFMEWECCGLIWQLLMWRGQPKRKKWAPQCPTCGALGKSCEEYRK